ncbi:MAG TPA: hypothetical protein VK709_12120 [Candidatus Saccharimonadales bacterium]|jgi:hypothetical protein|nr:hypothetical protein [Candidatus Saccharimonadales bacterium]
MSRIFDAIRIARDSRAQSGVNYSERLGQMDLDERRITPRKGLDIDLTVYGRLPGEETFYAQAKAISGNANGGVFLLSVPVAEGQDLLLINNGNSGEQICNIISVHILDMQMSEVSVSFPVPNAGFWKNS